jgi:hypothetical protein
MRFCKAVESKNRRQWPDGEFLQTSSYQGCHRQTARSRFSGGPKAAVHYDAALEANCAAAL